MEHHLFATFKDDADDGLSLIHYSWLALSFNRWKKQFNGTNSTLENIKKGVSLDENLQKIKYFQHILRVF